MSRRSRAACLAAGVLLCALAAAAPAPAAFPGRNGRIAFEGFGGGDSEIFTVDAYGRDRRGITHDSSGDDTPRFFPSGRRMAFEGCSPDGCGIFTMRADGTRARRLDWIPSDATQPTVSAHAIAFTRRLDQGVFVTNRSAHDHATRRVVGDLAIDPAFAPDGRLIAFKAGFVGAPGPNLYVIRPDGTHRRQLTHDAEHNASDATPSFSPDGRTVVFSRRSGTRGGLDCCEQEIYAIGVGGRNERRLTKAPGDAYNPAFSPDGRQIVLTRRAQRRWRIDVVDLATGHERAITTGNLGDVSSPDWQPLPR